MNRSFSGYRLEARLLASAAGPDESCVVLNESQTG
jgi:hypothetical protein